MFTNRLAYQTIWDFTIGWSVRHYVCKTCDTQHVRQSRPMSLGNINVFTIGIQLPAVLPTKNSPNRGARSKPIEIRVADFSSNRGAPIFQFFVVKTGSKVAQFRSLAAVLATLPVGCHLGTPTLTDHQARPGGRCMPVWYSIPHMPPMSILSDVETGKNQSYCRKSRAETVLNWNKS